LVWMPATQYSIWAVDSVYRPLSASIRRVRLYRTGDQGEAVRDIQDRLSALGFSSASDRPGVFSHATQTAVQGFQRARGLGADGIVGPDTWRTLVGAGFQLGDRLLYALEQDQWQPVGPLLDGSILSDDYVETSGTGDFYPCFTGAFYGLCCQDLSGLRQHADFGYFAYKEPA